MRVPIRPSIGDRRLRLSELQNSDPTAQKSEQENWKKAERTSVGHCITRAFRLCRKSSEWSSSVNITMIPWQAISESIRLESSSLRSTSGRASERKTLKPMSKCDVWLKKSDRSPTVIFSYCQSVPTHRGKNPCWTKVSRSHPRYGSPTP